MRNAARSGWELSRPEELIFELFRRPEGQAGLQRYPSVKARWRRP